MIYTLTANPAIDMNFSTNTIEPFKVNRTTDVIYSANGKGVNVSLTLKYFGIKSVVLGFFGGFTGKHIVDELKNKDIEIRACWVDEDTRINTFITNKDTEYKFVNKGPIVKREVQLELLDEIKDTIDGDILVISGSLPNGIEDEYYEEVVKCCKEKDIEVVLDISSLKLKELLKYKPKLIKPNDEEIKEIFGFDINDEEDIKHILKFLYNEGAQNILLTLGEKGLYFYNGKNAYYCTPQKVDVLSSACAGDACLAAFLSEWLNNEDNEDCIENALKKAASVGANVAESYGLGDFSKYMKYIKNINIKGVEVL